MDRLQELMPEFWAAALETLYMTSFALVLGGVLGLLIGVILYVTRPGGLLPNRAVSMLANLAVNIFRPIPFVNLINIHYLLVEICHFSPCRT